MTDDEIRERAIVFYTALKRSATLGESIEILEGVIRDEMARGLEMAAESCEREAEYDDESAYHAGRFKSWCLTKASEIKKGCGMTDNEIRERCRDFYIHKLTCYPEITSGTIIVLENLYREAMAKGLEMACEEIGQRINWYATTLWVNPLVRDLQLNEAAGCKQVCQSKADEIKKGVRHD